MFNEMQINSDLNWATKVAGILTQAADEFHADINALEEKWKRQARIKKAFPDGIFTIEETFYVQEILVNIEVLAYETEPADKSIGIRGGVYDVDFAITNYSGRKMNWLKKHLSEDQIQWIIEYVSEKVLF
jgi:hypothetical protein